MAIYSPSAGPTSDIESAEALSLDFLVTRTIEQKRSTYCASKDKGLLFYAPPIKDGYLAVFSGKESFLNS